jgi:release factor glutamine methyltransferase
MKLNDYPPQALKSQMIDVRQALAEMRQQLDNACDSPGLESQVLLGHVMGYNRAWILAHPTANLTDARQHQLEQLVVRRAQGTPLPYLLGHWEFFALDFEVSPAVLIPRPETELLVETALDWLKDHRAVQSAVDVGTGSGCIAISLAVHSPNLLVHASDLSRPALEAARRNAKTHGVSDRVHFYQADLLTAVTGPFHLICANLPYIPSAKLTSLPVTAHEPILALDGGRDGLALVGRLMDQCTSLLASGGLALFEIESTCGLAALTRARQAFPAGKIRLIKDLNGLDRLVVIEVI